MSSIAFEVPTEDGEVDATAEKVGGRGDPTNMNWGIGDPHSFDGAVERAQAMLPHVGEPVVLSGGGGSGWDIAILEDVAVARYGSGDGYRPKVFLDLKYGKHANNDFSAIGPKFSPWVGSWHISAFTDGLDAIETFLDRVAEN